MSVDRDSAEQIATDLVRVMKTLAALRQQMTLGPQAADRAFYPILLVLAEEPMRVSAVAERICSDSSTVSRHVATLVEQGLLERVPDAADGRAHLLGLTAQGSAAVDEARNRRTQWMQQLLQDWKSEDIDGLSTGLRLLLVELQNQRQLGTEQALTLREERP